MNPIQKITTARGTHRGIREDWVDGTGASLTWESV